MGFDVSLIQILIVLVIALLVFGPTRLPEVGRQIGRGIRELKGHMAAVTDDVRETRESARIPDAGAVGATADGPDDDLLDGVVVSGSDGPHPPR